MALEGRQRGYFEGTSSVIHPNMGQGGWAPGITEFCHSKDKEERMFCESNPYVGQYEFKTSRLRTKNGVVLLEENLPI